VLFVNTHKMLQHLHGGRADGTWAKRLSGYLRPELLILDDFGLKPLVDPAPSDRYGVINERYEVGSMLVTSNRAPTEWPDLFGNPLLASAGLDRLAHHAETLVITGCSFRAQGRQPPGLRHPVGPEADVAGRDPARRDRVRWAQPQPATEVLEAGKAAQVGAWRAGACRRGGRRRSPRGPRAAGRTRPAGCGRTHTALWPAAVRNGTMPVIVGRGMGEARTAPGMVW
jgi:hypothetical protein